MTLPSTSVLGEGSVCCLNKIRTFLRNTVTKADEFANLSKILIEKDLLNELQSTQPFYDDIIDKFASLEDRKMDLIFEK